MHACRRPTVTITAVVIAVAAIALASCGDDDDGSEQTEGTSAAAGSSSPPTGTTPTTEPTGSTGPPESTGPTEPTAPSSSTPTDESHAACAYRRDLLLVRFPDADHDPVSLNDVLSDPLSGSALAEQIGAVGDDADDLLDDLFAAEFIDAYNIAGGLDPLDVAADVEEAFPDTDASPVLLTTITGHWTYAPGADAIENVDDPGTAPAGAPDPQKLVAVVDTGYSDGELPVWLTGRAHALDSVDAEPTGADALHARVRGHGPFVASLIAQEAPLADIVVARVGNIEPGEAWTEDDTELATMIETGHASDELQLYVAVARLLGDEPPSYDALNLSLGSYTCGQALEDAPADADETALLDSGFAILGAMKRWAESTEEAPVFAAAGNHEVGATAPTPFIPAAYGQRNGVNVLGIGSVDAPGVDSDFSNPSLITALGRNLIGVRADGAWWGWSGTSFATAVATATFLNDQPVGPATSPLVPTLIQTVP